MGRHHVEREQYRRKRAHFNRTAAASRRHRMNVSRIAATGDGKRPYIPAATHPPAPTPGEPHAAPDKQERPPPTDWARVVVLPRPRCERRRAGKRAAEDRDLRRRLFLVRR